MTSISSGSRKAIAALLAVTAISGAMAPSAASAHGWGHHGGGYAAAGLLGGLIVGSAIADSSPYYERDVVYGRRCWTERQRFDDYDGYPHFRRVRVCD